MYINKATIKSNFVKLKIENNNKGYKKCRKRTFVSTQLNREKKIIIYFIKVAISKNKEVKFRSNHSWNH